jgi:hypothetical protein
MNMPHYNSHYTRAGAANAEPLALANVTDELAIEEAAEAIRRAELEAAPDPPEPDPSAIRPADLEQMSIDDLRVLARKLDVPGRSQITEQQELIDEIRRRLPSRSA